MTTDRQKNLAKAARLLRQFRQLPEREQQRQVRELLREQGARRRARENDASLSGTLEFLKNGRDVTFPVGTTRDGKTIWRAEDSHALAKWLMRSNTNPWTRRPVPKNVRHKVFRKALSTRHIGHDLSAHNVIQMQYEINTKTPPSKPPSVRRATRRSPGGAATRRSPGGSTTRRNLSSLFNEVR